MSETTGRVHSPTSEAEREQARYTLLSIADVAERTGVGSDQVAGWIHDGELTAMDVSKKGAKRRTYMVRPEWLEDFERRRTTRADAA